MQIIINRIALLAVSRTVIRRLKWGMFVFLALINISVFCIWIPSRLQISDRWRHINMIWDRIEKCLFALCDLGLNLYFVYLVRSSLVNYGLTKYVVLYRFNLAIIFISIGMDVRCLHLSHYWNLLTKLDLGHCHDVVEKYLRVSANDDSIQLLH